MATGPDLPLMLARLFLEEHYSLSDTIVARSTVFRHYAEWLEEQAPADDRLTKRDFECAVREVYPQVTLAYRGPRGGQVPVYVGLSEAAPRDACHTGAAQGSPADAPSGLIA